MNAFLVSFGCVDTRLNCLSLLVLRVIEGCVYSCQLHSFANTIHLHFGIMIFCLGMRIFVSVLAKYHSYITEFSCMRLIFCVLQKNFFEKLPDKSQFFARNLYDILREL